jgi:hypothetical protein
MKSTEINVDLTDEQLENLKECKYIIPLNILTYSPDLSGEKEHNKHNTVGAWLKSAEQPDPGHNEARLDEVQLAKQGDEGARGFGDSASSSLKQRRV